jgi:chromosome segregation ATPase
MLFTLSAASFACGIKYNAPKLSAETQSKIQAVKNAFSTEVAPMKEELKTLYNDLKKANTTKPVDKSAVKALKDNIASVNANIKAKQDVLNDTVNNMKLVATYGADAVARMGAAKAAYEKDVAPLKEKSKTLYASLKTAKSAKPVDTSLVKSIKNQINTVNSDILAKQKALNSAISRIIMVVKYGEATVVKIETAKASYEKEVAPLKEKIKTLSKDLNTVKSAKPVDTARVKSLKNQINKVNAEISAKKKALDSTIKALTAKPSKA